MFGCICVCSAAATTLHECARMSVSSAKKGNLGFSKIDLVLESG